MNRSYTMTLTGAALVMLPVAMLRAQQPAHNMPGMAQPPGQAQMAAADCARAQPALLQTIDAANMRLEAARQSNSPPAMRAAMDDLQGALGSLRAQLEACAAAMPGMPNVQQSPAAQPGTPVMQPGSPQPAPGAVNQNVPAPVGAAPAPAGAAPVDPHAGHATPGSTPAASPNAPAAQPKSAPPGSPTPARPEPGGVGAVMPGAHAGHAMPVADNVTLTRDPRCKAAVNPDTAPRAPHSGQMYYFCSESDRQLFVADPVKYLRTAPETQKGASPRSTGRSSATPTSPRSPAADPHAGHAMPAPQGAPRPPAAAAPATDPHAGHIMPTAPKSAAPSRGATQGPAQAPQPSGSKSGETPGGLNKPAATAGEHAGHSTTPERDANASPPAAADSRAGAPAAPADVPRPNAKTTAANPATDMGQLLCDNRVQPKTAPRMLHGGRMYYFCSESDRAEFAKSPEKYVKAAETHAPPRH